MRTPPRRRGSPGSEADTHFERWAHTAPEQRAFQRWRRFKEAFDPQIVERALRETAGTVEHIADPFGGSGTTALAAQLLGAEPTTIEVNPFLADLIEAKLAPADAGDVRKVLAQVRTEAARDAGPEAPAFEGAPATFVEPGAKGKYLFSRALARTIIAHRRAVERIGDAGLRRIARVVLAAAALASSNATVSGKGRRYRRRWRERQTRPEALGERFETLGAEVVEDLGRFARRGCARYRLMRGDARTRAAEIGRHDLAVFSPPYANSFDYTDVYNVELWTMGYLASTDESRALRRATLRSHVQIKRAFDAPQGRSATLTRTVEALREARTTLWSPYIPEMIAAYAHDIATVLDHIARGLRPRGRAYVVVGDSRYGGVDVPIAEIVCEIAHARPWRVRTVEPARSMRASPQQGGREELAETLVVLEKPSSRRASP